MNTSEDKQLNYYSELLRIPNERALSEASLLTNSSVLSIKMINKKQVVARMNKFKADLYLLLNLVDSALLNYSNAYSQAKKEPENTIWAISALEGLCVASFIYLTDTRHMVNGGASVALHHNVTASSVSSSNFLTSSPALSSINNRTNHTDLSQTCMLNLYYTIYRKNKVMFKIK